MMQTFIIMTTEKDQCNCGHFKTDFSFKKSFKKLLLDISGQGVLPPNTSP